MVTLNRPVIVEGKYDKITLENVIDTLIIPTNGFAVFKDKEKCDLIRTVAKDNGVIIMTDSDSAGNLIRSYLKKIIGDEKIINVYIPEILGKEKRKKEPSKEGTLGVEGMTPEIIKAALEKSGVFATERKAKTPITKTDMFLLGLSGGVDSSKKREGLLEFLGLPTKLSPSAMLDVLNNMFSLEEFRERAKKWQNHTDKS